MIKRICKYPILFRELIKNIDFEDQRYSKLIDVLNQVEKVTESVNEGQRFAEQNQRILEIQNNMDNQIVTF